MNPHTGRDFVQFGKTESVLNKGAEKIAPLFNPPPVLSLEIIVICSISGIVGITLIGIIIKLLLCMCVSRYFSH